MSTHLSSPWRHHESRSPSNCRCHSRGDVFRLRHSTAISAEPQTATERLNQPGPEAQALARRAGTWDVTFTNWEAPGDAPTVVTGLVAERRMIGPMLEETLRPAPNNAGNPFVRVDDLTFNRLEGRWQYMSMDSRVPFGLMTAASLDADPEQRVFVSFTPFATTGGGPVASGQIFRTEQVIQRQDADHETKDQYFTPAGSAPVKWLAKRYSYRGRVPRSSAGWGPGQRSN